jgi:hypothetical protein
MEGAETLPADSAAAQVGALTQAGAGHKLMTV